MPKPRKVEEAAAAYVTSPKAPQGSAQPNVRYARSEDVRQSNARLMQVHRKVLQKLAQ